MSGGRYAHVRLQVCVLLRMFGLVYPVPHLIPNTDGTIVLAAEQACAPTAWHKSLL
jgi:hypothetical protein